MTEMNREVVRPKADVRSYPMGIRSLLGNKTDAELCLGCGAQGNDGAVDEDGDEE